MIRHNFLGLAASLAALAFTAPPLAAQEHDAAAQPSDSDSQQEKLRFLTEEEEAREELEKELTDSFAVMSELFKAEPLTADQEALVPLASQMADIIMPQGSFGDAVKNASKPMLAMFGGAADSDPRARLAEVSGVEADDLAALSDDDA